MTATGYDTSEDAARATAPAKRQVLVAPANADLPNGNVILYVPSGGRRECLL